MFVTATFRFYEELNDFLPVEKRKVAFSHQFAGGTSVKDIIESQGVPHTEVDLILINGKSVDFAYQVNDGDYVSIYPVFEAIDVQPVTRLRPEPLRNTCFVVDVHLGKLTKYLRLLGFDTAYQKNHDDKEIIAISEKEKRIILTRDIGLLKHKKVTHGYFLRETNPKKQIKEVVEHFDLIRKCRPFTRCLECNGLIEKINESNIPLKKIPPRVIENRQEFYQCNECSRVYWQGTHYAKLRAFVDEVMQNNVS